eukprot:Gb_18425 [translate_table: standard]
MPDLYVPFPSRISKRELQYTNHSELETAIKSAMDFMHSAFNFITFTVYCHIAFAFGMGMVCRRRGLLLCMSLLWALIRLISGDDVSKQISITGSNTVGINYGQIASNLPPPEIVVQILESVKISRVKLYDSNPDILKAFAKKEVEFVVGIENELVGGLKNPQQALDWVKQHVQSFMPDTEITGIAVGNEVYTGEDTALMANMVPAMQSIHSALVNLGLDTTVKISTGHSLGVLGNLYPPSAGFFKPDLTAVVKPLLDFLSQTGAPFWINAYPYFAYKDNPGQVSLDYVLFQPNAGITCSMPMWMRFILRLLPWVMLIWKSESQRPDGLLKAIRMKPEQLLRMPRSITKTFCSAKLRTRGLP